MQKHQEPDLHKEALTEQAKALHAHVRKLRLMAIVICLLLVFIGLVFGFMRMKHGAGELPQAENRDQEADTDSPITP